MPRSGDTYTLPYNWEDDAANDVNASAARFQEQDQDMADALTASATIAKIQSGAYLFAGTAGGSANALTITLSPAPSALTNGMRVRFTAASTNTAQATLNVNSLGALNTVRPNLMATQAGDIVMGQRYEAEYDSSSGGRWIVREIGFQPVDEVLTLLSGLTPAANTIPYFDGTSSADLLALGSTGADLIAGTSSAEVLTLLGVSAFAQTLLDDADAAAARTTLGLTIGTDVQAYDATLQAIAGQTTGADMLVYFTGTDTAATTTLTSTGRSLIAGTSGAQMMAVLGVEDLITDTARTFDAPQRGEIATLTDGATITPDFSVANNFTVTINGNRTLANPTNIEAGQGGSIFIVQGTTGNHTLSFGTAWDTPGGTAPTLSTSANAVDRLHYLTRTTSSIHCNLAKDVK